QNGKKNRKGKQNGAATQASGS
ncbi:hypothetical protein D046_6249B, partial [Vibrio parahaemolyticus V-223/04]